MHRHRNKFTLMRGVVSMRGRLARMTLVVAALGAFGCSSPGLGGPAKPASPPPAVSPVTLSSALAPLTPLIGEWTADFPNGMTDTKRFEPMVGGTFLRSVHWVTDAEGRVVYEGESIYGPDPEADPASGAMLWWYFNATGGWMHGTLVVRGDGTLLFDGDNHATGNQTPRVMVIIDLDEVAAGRYSNKSWSWHEGRWVAEGELAYRREVD